MSTPHGHGHGHDHDVEQVPPDERWTESFWDERYAAQPSIWSGHVNAVLAAEAAGLTPGCALDVGCGEGGDVLWLAEQGWTVTGVDVSQVALDRAAARAEQEGLSGRTTFEKRDLLAWAPEPQSYDLVSAGFIHLPSGTRRHAYADLAAAVATGGSFLVMAHHPSDIGVVPRPPEPDLFFTAEDLAEQLDPDLWDVVVAEARPRPGTHPDGHAVTLHDTVMRAVRR